MTAQLAQALPCWCMRTSTGTAAHALLLVHSCMRNFREGYLVLCMAIVHFA